MDEDKNIKIKYVAFSIILFYLFVFCVNFRDTMELIESVFCYVVHNSSH